jgi:hypothetical protein
METIQVQPADAGATTLPVVTASNGTPTGDDSFASTLDRALGTSPTSSQDGFVVPPKASRQKPAAGDNADSTAMAGTFLNCFMANLVQPTPAVTLGTNVSASTVSFQGSASETSTDPALTNVVTGSGLVSPAGQNKVAAPSNSQPVSAPAWFPGFQDPSVLCNTVERQTVGGSADSGQSLASTPAMAGEQGARLPSPTSPNFAQPSAWSGDLGVTQPPTTPQPTPAQVLQASANLSQTLPHDEQMDPAQLQAAFQSESKQHSQASSSSVLPLNSSDQAAQASGQKASDPSTQIGEGDDPGHQEFTSLLAKFAGAELNVKISGTESRRVSDPNKFTTANRSAESDASMGGPPPASVSSPQIQTAPKSENTVAPPAREVFHTAQLSSSLATDSAWQNANGADTASIPAPLSAATIPTRHLDADAQPATPVARLQKDAAPQASGFQPGSLAAPTSGTSVAHGAFSDSSTNGQGKSGQQSGPRTGDNSTGVKAIKFNAAANTVADPATNLLTAQAPHVSEGHASTLPAQTPPPASQPPATLAAWQNYEGGAGTLVRSAGLSDSARGAEMHVELRSGPLGPLEVHAVVREGSVGAEIHVEDHQAQTLLTAGLPSLERAMGERNLHVGNIAVYQDHVGGGMSGGENQNPHSGSSPSPQPPALRWDNPPQPGSTAQNSSEVDELAGPATGLSVRA